MYLLPLLTGFLFCFQGPDSHVLGARNAGAAKDIENYMNDIDELRLLEQILQTSKRRQEELHIQEPEGEWSYNQQPNHLNTNKQLRDELGLAVEETPNEDVITAPRTDIVLPSNDAHQSSTHESVIKDKNVETKDNNPAGTTLKAETSSKDPVRSTHDPPIPPEKLTQEDGSSEIRFTNSSFLFLALVSACSIAGLAGLIMAGVCWYKLHNRVKAASDVEYPAYGVTGPTKERLPSPGDRKLAQSAQMYHYQHQKQQMIAMEKANGEMKHDASEDESEEENEEGDYTVYECPGLAPTGEMEVRNPLFTEDAQTPVNGQTSAVNGLTDDHEQE